MPSQRHLFTAIGENAEICVTCSLIEEIKDDLGETSCGWVDSYFVSTTQGTLGYFNMIENRST